MYDSTLPQNSILDYTAIAQQPTENGSKSGAAYSVSTLDDSKKNVSESENALHAPLKAHKGAFNFGELPELETKDSKHDKDGRTCRVLGIDLDAEWEGKADTPNQFITVQCRDYRSNNVSVFEHPSLGDRLLPTWSGLTPLPEILQADEHRGMLPKGIKAGGRLRVCLSLFFSYGDIRAFFGGKFGSTIARQIQRLCDQKRRINHRNLIDIGNYYLKLPDGTWYQVFFEIQDTCGLMGLGGLKDYAAKVGLELSDKGLMDDCKSHMLTAYRDPARHEDFVTYAAGDCVSHKILIMFAAKLNSEVLPALGLRGFSESGKECGESFDVENMPLTIGAIVEATLRKFMQRLILSDWKPGDRDEKVTNYNAQHLLYPVAYDPEKDIAMVSADWILSLASVKTLIDNVCRDNTAIQNLLVQGGRCKNEFSTSYKVEGIVPDADISGCYGNGLMNQDYPMGLPTSIHYGFRQEKPTLASLLSKWEHEFVPGLWQLVIDLDKLSYEQSLIFSKVISDKKFYALVKQKFEAEDPEVDVSFTLLTKEIQNGIVTHDVLQALRAVCTTQELNEFLEKAVVKAGMFYPKSQRCNSAQEWQAEIAKRPGLIECELTEEFHQIDTDKRSRKWFSFSLSEFIRPLLRTRSFLKKERSKHDKNSVEYRELNAKQELFKLFINTTYGVLASPYFASGNVVVANNITARARVLAWGMSVACGGVQSITDGSAYDANKVRYRKNGLMPGMNTLTRLNRGGTSDRTLERCLTFGSLGGEAWSFEKQNGYDIILKVGDRTMTGGDGNWPEIDLMYKQHLQKFFEGKQLDCLEQFDFEHKNVYAGMTFQSQSNYSFTCFDGSTKTKARGHSLKKERKNIQGNVVQQPVIEQLFDDLRSNGKTRPYSTEITSAPLKVNAANEGSDMIDSNGLLAGDSVSKSMRMQSVSLSGFMWPTAKLRDKWMRYNDSLIEKKGWGLDGVFYNSETGFIEYARALVEIQAAIDAGKDWIPGMKSADKIPSHPIWLEEQEYLFQAAMKKHADKQSNVVELTPVRTPVKIAAASKATGGRLTIKPKGFGSPPATGTKTRKKEFK